MPSKSSHQHHPHPDVGSLTTATAATPQPPMPSKSTRLYPSKSSRRTGWHIWGLAVICTIITIAVIIVGIVIFVGYLVIHPKVPSITVTYTQLDVFNFDPAGILSTRLIIHVKWVNDNARAHVILKPATFSLGLQGIQIAKLRSDELEVSKRSSEELEYVVESKPIPLGPGEMEVVDSSLKRNALVFHLDGIQKTRWRVWLLGSLSFWLRLDCQLHFAPWNLTSTGTYCRSKPK